MSSLKLKSSAEALLTAARLVQESGISGLKRGEAERLQREIADGCGSGSISVEWERAWTVGASLYVRMRSERTEKVMRAYPLVEVTWSSTGRGVSAAVASLALYGQVVALAALIEATLAHEEYGEVRS